MLANVGCNKGIAVGHFPQLFNHKLGFDEFIGFGVVQTLAATPFLNLFPPALQFALVYSLAAFFQQLNQINQHVFDVANNGHIHFHALGNGRRVDINVNDFAWNGGKIFGITDHAIVKTGANGDQYVAILHGQVGLIGAVHAGHTYKLFVAGLECAQTHQGIGCWRTNPLYQTSQFSRGITQNNTTAGIDHGALGFQNHLHGFFDLPLVTLDHRVVRAHFDWLGVIKRGFVNGDVFGDINQHRAWTACAGNVKRFFHDTCQVFHILYKEVVLDAGACNTHGIAFLECILTDRVRGHLTRQNHHGN